MSIRYFGPECQQARFHMTANSVVGIGVNDRISPPGGEQQHRKILIVTRQTQGLSNLGQPISATVHSVYTG